MRGESVEAFAAYEHLAFERNDGVLTVRLNRPEAKNAVNAGIHHELSRVFADIRADRETRAVVLTGEGRAFSAGGDLNWFRDMTEEGREALFAEARRIAVDMLEVPQPIVAAVNGPAIGLGATLALFCDIVIAAENALFGDPHVLVGVVAGDGGAVIWPWLVGVARAKEFLLTGDNVGAEDAYRMGLVNRVVPSEDLLATAHQLAARLAAGPVKAIQGTKASVNSILRDTVNLVLDKSLALERECFTTADHREAVSAFLERRTPVFNAH
jgi:enoyl-CoA hydratase